MTSVVFTSSGAADYFCPIGRKFMKTSRVFSFFPGGGGVNIPLRCDTVYVGDTSFEGWSVKDRKLSQTLLAASEKGNH